MDIVYKIEDVPKGRNDRPVDDVVIADCGELAVEPEANSQENEEFDNTDPSVQDEPAKIAKPEFPTPTTTVPEESKVIPQSDERSGGFTVLFLAFVILAVFAAAFFRLGGMHWISRRVLRRGRSPRYHRVGDDLEK